MLHHENVSPGSRGTENEGWVLIRNEYNLTEKISGHLFKGEKICWINQALTYFKSSEWQPPGVR